MLYLSLFQTGGWGRTRYGDLRWLDATTCFISLWGLGEDVIWRPEMARCYSDASSTLNEHRDSGEDTIWRPEVARCYYMLHQPLFHAGGWGRTRYGDLRWLDATRCFINLCFTQGVGGGHDMAT